MNLNGFSLAANLLQKAPFTAMLLQRPAKAGMEADSWRHSFQVDSVIHLAGDLFIFDMYWPRLPATVVWLPVKIMNFQYIYFRKVRLLCLKNNAIKGWDTSSTDTRSGRDKDGYDVNFFQAPAKFHHPENPVSRSMTLHWKITNRMITFTSGLPCWAPSAQAVTQKKSVIAGYKVSYS